MVDHAEEGGKRKRVWCDSWTTRRTRWELGEVEEVLLAIDRDEGLTRVR